MTNWVCLPLPAQVWDLASGNLVCNLSFMTDVTSATMDFVEEFVYAGCGDGKIQRARMTSQAAGASGFQSDASNTLFGHTLPVTCTPPSTLATGDLFRVGICLGFVWPTARA